MTKQIFGNIFDIKRFAVNDGPGIRTTIFLKGCPLKCLWCHNPESILSDKQLAYYNNLCVKCGLCVETCLNNVHKIKDGKHLVDYSKCELCGLCCRSCPKEALKIIGETKSAQETMDIILKDKTYFDTSDGGVTISGGEPTYQSLFTKEVLKKCKENGIHTAVDTCGYCNWKILKQLLPFTDLLLYDIKIINSQKHKDVTGVGNELILDNLKKISALQKNINIRYPLIPNINDSPDDIKNLSFFLISVNVHEIEIIPYHDYARTKYSSLGWDYRVSTTTSNNKENKTERILKLFDKNGIHAYIQ